MFQLPGEMVLGLILYFFDNSSNGSSELPVTLDITGATPSGDVTVSLDDTWTLVGNPFYQSIKIDDLAGNGSGSTQNGLKSPIQVWSDASGSFETPNFGDDDIISAWQGFFLERDDAETLTIPASAQTGGTITISFFSKIMGNKQTHYRTLA